MNVLDENISVMQRQLLRGWRIPARHIGYETGQKGMTDDEIIPFLLSLRRPTFFTLDWDFYTPILCHKRYCMVLLDVRRDEAALFIRRLLRHSQFDTQGKRMGMVARATYSGVYVWLRHASEERYVSWE
jgi:hypothetical protein